jgi:hypothetical protein
MLNSAEHTGSGAVMFVWSYPLSKHFRFYIIKNIMNLQLEFVELPSVSLLITPQQSLLLRDRCLDKYNLIWIHPKKTENGNAEEAFFTQKIKLHKTRSSIYTRGPKERRTPPSITLRWCSTINGADRARSLAERQFAICQQYIQKVHCARTIV